MEQLTKDDLLQLRIVLLSDIEKLIERKIKASDKEPQEWLRSKSIRNILGISPGTLQNLRITGKIRYKKVMGSYYYNRVDLEKLFGDGEG
ncbi:helix-turn-helix domain-containing protein [Agriterribacter sp.]|uniref:helix-turn-helix domain-containing protein n=1 Tax=Agriterribacter sp. TaxID=2821509 RepID=UPI002BF75F09|nr:helix-turn-helix domain-containing protein [Agriterribacter sp.]HRO46235.1 helix-turn-helix domain-containing protein [Agriterribacter sp.]HRQ18484.1 helix-turn-helix domain-containing protein [Agriterribacter sp.]